MQEQKEIMKLCSVINQTNENPSQNNFNERHDQAGSESLRKFLLRHLSFKFTCPLTVLYGAMMAGKEFPMTLFVRSLRKLLLSGLDDVATACSS